MSADPNLWMHDSSSPEFLAYLAEERAMYDAARAHLIPLASTIAAEAIGRVSPSTRSASWRRTRFSYYTEFPEGKDYAQLVRDRDLATDSVVGAVILNENTLTDGSGYLDLAYASVSPDEDRLAYAVDTTGDEVFCLRFRDLTTGVDLPDVVDRTYYGCAWSTDSSAFYYTVHDEAYRPFEVRRHVLGTDPAADTVVVTEPDERFEVVVRRTRSGALVVWSESNSTSEVWLLDCDDPAALPRSVGGRRPGVRYHAEYRVLADGNSDFLIVTDDEAVEGRLMRAPVPPPGGQDHRAWTQVRAERASERLLRVDAFSAGVVASVRVGGQHVLRSYAHDALDADTPAVEVRSAHVGSDVYLSRTPDYDSPVVAVLDEARTEPAAIRSVDLRTAAEEIVWREPAPGYDPTRYVTSRHTFASVDGTQVPCTVIRHRDTPLDGTAPCLLYGYGAYEVVFEPEWEPALPSLLDRGVVYAFTHIRGGGEGGRAWYLDGKMATKKHTFDDHIAVADGLAAEGLVDGSRIATRGLSAGGLLQGAVFSQRPDRWAAVVAEVPFVDVITSMFDETTPLTITEWEEWGDPRIPEQFAWLAGYDPIRNLPPAGARPDLLATGSLHDPRVMVREPAKWVAALKASDPDWAPRCLFRAETGAGAHAGPSGRFGQLEYEAEIYAWVLDRLGMAER
ncbi:MAG: prolyl oligopeptidase family serine peptidase [Nocardioides sp.]